MDYRDTADEAEFRSRLRQWIAAHAPTNLPQEPDEREAALNKWHQELYRAGWIGLTFPVEYGGHGMSPIYEAILNDELGVAGAPPPPAIGHLSNALRLFGSDEQKRTYLPGLLSSTERWCQGFSEPNAGSDLAGITTTATRHADSDGTQSYRISGQKIWTSEAIWSQWCLLLCRSEADVPAHRALTMLVVPMHTPGVECREIVTAYGTREFAEVFFDDAEVPASNVVGQPGDGWMIAMQLLGYERGPADVGWVARLARTLTQLETDVRDGRVAAGPCERRSIARAWIDVRTLQLHVQRTMSSRNDGSTPGSEGSIDKLLVTRAEQLVNHVNLAVRGAAPILDVGADLEAYFWSRAQSIFGGTQQIQRNIVAQRVLGLPRS
jgi:alkylation response protein AidB-like acyl-CoA dehydrogenase